MRLILPLTLALGLAVPAAADVFGSPPPSPHMAAQMEKVLTRARTRMNKEISPGVKLTAATSQGNTVIFMTRADNVPAVERGLIRDANLTLQERFVKTFGQKYCRKGTGTRKFVDAGGSISIAALNRSGKLMVGGKLTRCR